MDDMKGDIKKALDGQIFNQLNLTDSEASQFVSSLKQKAMKRRTKVKLSFIAPAAAVILVLIFSGVLISGLIQENDGKSGSQSEIKMKDEIEEINEAVKALEAGNRHPNLEVVHIELIEENKAIAFYEWSDDKFESFGNVILEKKLFKGWEIVSGGSLYLVEDSMLNWGHLDLSHHISNYTDLLRGKITDPEIEEVRVITKGGSEYQAKVIEYDKNNKFWYLITDGEDLLGATVTGLSSEDEVIEEIITTR